MKVAIVASKFNQDISNNLIKGALAKLKKNNFSSKNVTIYEVPGAFEIPLAALTSFFYEIFYKPNIFQNDYSKGCHL